MFTALSTAHSYLRYILLILLVINIVTTLYGWLGKRKYSNVDDKLSLALFISTHLQLTLGLVLYFLWTSQSGVFADMKSTMQTPALRYFTVEHLVGMLVAIVSISLGRIIAKKATTDEDKFKRAFIYFATGLVVIAGMLWHMPGSGQ